MRRMPRAVVLLLLASLGAGAAFRAAGVGGRRRRPRRPPDRSSWRWYKGNTHTHTLESDGDSTPEEVTRWYQERGYQFLVLSDHNVLIGIDGPVAAVRHARVSSCSCPAKR